MTHVFEQDPDGLADVDCLHCPSPPGHPIHGLPPVEEPVVQKDPEQGRHLRIVGQEAALEAPDVASWKDQAQRTLVELAATGYVFTADDLVERVGLPRGVSEQNVNNALGGLFSSASRRKVIEKVGYAESERGARHSGKLGRWRGTRTAPEPDQGSLL